MINIDNIILSSEMRLADWLVFWLETYIRPVVKPSTYESYRGNCEKHIIPALGEIKLEELCAKEIQVFFNAKAKSGNSKTGGCLSPKSIRNMRVVLDVAIKQALSLDLIHANPIPQTVIKSVKTKKLEVMTEEMQESLEEYLFETEDPYHPAILFALYTGVRRGELCALRWRDYNKKAGRITIDETVRRLTNYDGGPGAPKTIMVFNDTKTESSARELQLPEVLCQIVDEQYSRFAEKFRTPQPDDFIFFSSNGHMLDPDNLQHKYQRILRKLNLEHIKFHAIRHSFATRAIEDGIDVATVSGILGHANVTTTTRFYVHPREKAMTRAMKTITPIYNRTISDSERLVG